MSTIAGSMVALVTPMKLDGTIDYVALKRLVLWHIESGTAAIIAVGTTGESATLNVDEHCDVIRFIVDTVAGKIPVIAGTGANSTSEAIELSNVAKRIGADACLLVSPYYNKPTQEGLFRHHKKIAETVDIPNILYNVPGRTAVDMLPETTSRLADIPNIVGIKDATGDLQRGQELIRLCGDKLDVYSGDDATATELMIMGAVGNISVTANVVPSRIAEVCRLAVRAKGGERADKERVLKLDNALQQLHAAMFVESNPIPVKWALYKMGLIEQGIRLPMTPLSEQHHNLLEQILLQQNIIDSQVLV